MANSSAPESAAKSYTLAFNMINREKYEYYAPHRNDNGSYICTCRYRLSRNEVVPVYFETPRFKTSTGIVKIDNDFLIDLEIPFIGVSSPFYEYIVGNDEYNIQQCHQNSKDWFNKHLPLHIIERYYKSCLVNRAGGSLPIWRVRIPSYKGKIIPEIYNNQKELLDPSYIESGDEIVCIVEFIGLQFHEKQFTPQYEIQKMKIFKPSRSKVITKGFLFSDDGNEDTAQPIPSQPIPSQIKHQQQSIVVNNTLLTNIYSGHISSFLTKSEMIKQPKMISKKPTHNIHDISAKKEESKPVQTQIIEQTKSKSRTEPIQQPDNIEPVSEVLSLSTETSNAVEEDNLTVRDIDEDLLKLYADYESQTNERNIEDDNILDIDTELQSGEEDNDISINDDMLDSDEEDSIDMEMDDSDLLDLELVH